ncbi:hypothetical protein BJ875DRAFT_448056 [Amylocarpus encephaloides]|uniref:Uncharacterized protein n=1 Tax=Amylocarpus encephaloides TaxID=45428 RepID=A0A9P7YT12_9HELO|nr:hypothetical protein BJ875DRAFT_448056 [Amylocarpus encephaloides]
MISTNPNQYPDIVDGRSAFRASPVADEKGEGPAVEKVAPILPLSTPLKVNDKAKSRKVPKEGDMVSLVPTPVNKPKKTPTKS